MKLNLNINTDCIFRVSTSLLQQLLAVPGLTFFKSWAANQSTLHADYSVGTGTGTFISARNASTPSTYVDNNGVVQLVTSANTPRYQGGYYDSNGFHAQTGLMIENVGTNLLTDTDGTLNGSGIWTNWSKATGGSGTITTTNNDATGLLNIAGSKTQRIQYTGQAGDSNTYVYVAGPITGTGTIAQNNVVTVSCWARSTSGSIPVELWIVSRNSSGSSLTTYNGPAITLTTSWRRYQFTATITDATVSEASFRFGPNQGVNNGSNVDYEIVAPQMEINTHGSYATSFIPTTTTSLSRASDELTYPIASNRTANQETIFIKFAPEYNSSTSNSTTYLMDTDTKSRGLYLTSTSATFLPNATDSPTVLVSGGTVTSYSSTVIAAVASAGSPYASLYSNGALVGTYSTGAFTAPSWGTNFYIASTNAGANVLNGVVQSMAIYNTALTAGQVNTISIALANN